MASTKAWFEGVAQAQRRAKKRLPKSVYMALVAGSELGVTLRDNVLATRRDWGSPPLPERLDLKR